jgi:hypothetical protein
MPVRCWAPPFITMNNHFAMGAGGTLSLLREVDLWDSQIWADGRLSKVGTAGVAPTGTFAVSSPYVSNLTKLYTTGEVTLTAVLEPPTVVPLAMRLASWPIVRLHFVV